MSETLDEIRYISSHVESPNQSRIAVFRPNLPRASRLLPYLHEIDRERWYTNHGPLLGRFEQALARHFRVEADRVVVVANATAGLSLCLLANGPSSDGLCIMPSWTHEASAVAAVRAGLTPWLHDVDEANWQLDPADVADSLRDGRRIGGILVTAPFGAAVDAEAWADLSDRTGIPVVIDAASGFDSLRGGRLDAVVSLHATKVLGIGEGGVVVARDAAQADRIRDLGRLGLTAGREIRQAGMNAKLSEYGAAVGLAALEGWPERRAILRRLRDGYAQRLGTGSAILWRSAGLSSTLMVRLPGPLADAVAAALDETGIETRRWWHRGCHRQPAFASAPRRPLPVTEALADSVLGLPFHDDVTMEQLDRVVIALDEALHRPA